MKPAQELLSKITRPGGMPDPGFISRYPALARQAGITNAQAAELASQADAIGERRRDFDFGRAVVVVNRDGPVANGGFLHVVPKGELPNEEAGITQVLDDKALDSILFNIHADHKRLGSRWPGVYLGHEHDIYDPKKSSEAYGWLTDFEKRADGLWASDEGLTDKGRDAIKNKRFKYTSFCADPADTEDLGGGRVRILKLDTVGLTNYPNGKDILTPIVNRPATPGVSQPGTLSPEEALKTFTALVSGLQKEYGWSHEKALQEAQSRFPAVYAATGVNSGELAAIGNRKHVEAINNRASQIQRDTGLSNRGSIIRAQREASADAGEKQAQKILNRAAEIQQERPGTPYATAVIEAEREIKSAS